MNAWEQRTLALAGLVQAAVSVQQIARHGHVSDKDSADALYDAVLNLNPPTTEATFGNRNRLALGLRALLQQIGATRDKDVEVTRYVVGLMALERRLAKESKSLQALGERLQQVTRQKQDFGFEQETIIASLAAIYSDIISPLSQPLRINGNPTHLQQRMVQSQIRALLLAGIRCVVLWRQSGGKRRHFIFSRQRMVAAAKHLLTNSITHVETNE